MDEQRRKYIERYLGYAEPDAYGIPPAWPVFIRDLLSEIDRLEAELETYAAEFCPHVKFNYHANKYCEIMDKTIPIAEPHIGLGEK